MAEITSTMRFEHILGDTERRLQPAATDAQIEAFEDKYHLRLPVAYKEWLKFSDGGEVNGATFFGVNALPTLSDDADWSPIEGWIVIGFTANGDSIMFRENSRMVVIFDHETGTIHTGEMYDNFYVFLKDFCAAEDRLNLSSLSARLTPDTLGTYGFRVHQGINSALCTTVPRTVDFCGAEFAAEFYFSSGKLQNIKLMPIVPGVADPGYPDAEYQAVKRQWCARLLREAYGEPQYNAEDCEVWRVLGSNAPKGFKRQCLYGWRCQDYSIICYSLLDGKAVNEGGNIAIDFRGRERSLGA